MVGHCDHCGPPLLLSRYGISACPGPMWAVYRIGSGMRTYGIRACTKHWQRNANLRHSSVYKALQMHPSRAVFAHAHEIANAESRKLPSCSLRASNKFEDVWPSSMLTQTRKNHVLTSLLLSLILEKNSQQAVVIGQNSIFKVCSIVDAYLIETLCFPMSSARRLWIGLSSLPSVQTCSGIVTLP
jgi:hypothetical protein